MSDTDGNAAKDAHDVNEIKPTEEWDKSYWSYNCPLQMWKADDGGWRVLNYMPRKEMVKNIETIVTPNEMPQFCRNASARLRNLAALFDAMAKGDIDYIYYPDRNPYEVDEGH